MNTEAAAYEARVSEETAFLGGPDAFRQAALENLRLKTVIKESHGSDVVALTFHPHPSLRTLLATAGGDQATVYDDAYLGAHVSAVVQWTNEPSSLSRGGELCSLCWLPRAHRGSAGGRPLPGRGLRMHPDGDALLLAGSRAGEVALLSVAEGRVMGILRAHEDSAVAELAALRREGRSLLASRSEEGQVCLWDLDSGQLLDACHEPAAASMCWQPDGEALVLGLAEGRLLQRPVLHGDGGVVRFADAASWSHVPGVRGAIDSLTPLSASLLLVKSALSELVAWDAAAQVAQARWTIPGRPASPALARGSSRPGASPDGRYVACGNAEGETHVHDARTGQPVARLAPERVAAPVAACALSADGRRVVAAAAGGFVFRYEVSLAALEERRRAQEAKAANALDGEREQACQADEVENADGNAAVDVDAA